MKLFEEEKSFFETVYGEVEKERQSRILRVKGSADRTTRERKPRIGESKRGAREIKREMDEGILSIFGREKEKRKEKRGRSG